MAQYKTGTVSVTNGSAVITGTGTQFLSNAIAGNGFKVASDTVVYQIASVVSDTEITLSAPYAGPTQSNMGYQITRDYTVNFGLAEVSPNDVDWPTHLTVETIRRVDEILAGMASGYIVKGPWNAENNTPPIPPASAGNTGWLYNVVVAGNTSIDGISIWLVGDTLVSNGSIWFRLPTPNSAAADSAASAAASAASSAASANEATTQAINASASAALAAMLIQSNRITANTTIPDGVNAVMLDDFEVSPDVTVTGIGNSTWKGL